MSCALLAVAAVSGAAAQQTTALPSAPQTVQQQPDAPAGQALGSPAAQSDAAPASATARETYTWTQLRTRFEASNPNLIAGQLNIEESRADEITANLRPNPTVGFNLDQMTLFTGHPYRPLQYAEPIFSASYLWERDHKRQLRTYSARAATQIAISAQADLDRTLVFNLRNEFVATLQAKEVLALTQQNLEYYDRVLSVSRDRYNAGDIARVDLDRLELQRSQYESDLQTAIVNLRTAKIDLLTLLNDRTPVEQFDVIGEYDFPNFIPPLEEFRQDALATRPDLKEATQAVEKAKIDHRLAVANGSTDPTFSVDIGRDPPVPEYLGVGIEIPLRIFDRNQGNKKHTLIDIDRQQHLRDAAEAQVLSDVDSAYATILGNITVLKRYKEQYLDQALRVRDTISYSYNHGGASLLDFLDAQNDYRTVRLNYLQMVGTYMTAAAQLSQAVGHEVLQ